MWVKLLSLYSLRQRKSYEGACTDERKRQTDFPTFQRPHVEVRRRFTDFVYLWKTLLREFPACAVPPLPDKHKMGE